MTSSPTAETRDAAEDQFTWSKAEIDELISSSHLAVGLDTQINTDTADSLSGRIELVEDRLNSLPRLPWIASPDLTVCEALGDLPDLALEAHNIYVESLKSGTGGREGMIAALSIATELTKRVVQDDIRCSQLLEPLIALSKSLRELSRGVENPALVKCTVKRGRPATTSHSRKLAFIIRCVWAVEACEDMGDPRPYQTVHKIAQSTSEQFFAGSRYQFLPSTIERWRVNYKKEIEDHRLETISWIPFREIRREALLLGLTPENLDRSLDAILHDLGLRVERMPKNGGGQAHR